MMYIKCDGLLPLSNSVVFQREGSEVRHSPLLLVTLGQTEWEDTAGIWYLSDIQVKTGAAAYWSEFR